MADKDGAKDWAGFYQWAFSGACSLVILLAGALAGLWARAYDQRLDSIETSEARQWEIINGRAGLPARVESVERQVADIEQRKLPDFDRKQRELEQRVWRLR